MKKRQRHRSKRDLAVVIAKHAEDGGPPLDFDEDETTDVIDLTLARIKAQTEQCQHEVRESTEALRTLRCPEPGPTEKI